MTSTRPICGGIGRREFLRVGSLGAFGFGLTLTDLLGLEALSAKEADSPNATDSRRDLSVIYLFLAGGLSTIDTFDMKPDAPTEIRGEFKPIPTNVPGIHYCEHLPRLARHADKLSLIRSLAHGDSNHGSADKYMLTGYLRQERPSFGSVVAHEFGRRGSVPPYVVFPRMHAAAGPAFLGSKSAPFIIDADPSSPGFSVPDLAPPLDVDGRRLGDRRHLLRQVDRFHQMIDKESRAGTFSRFRERAFQLMTSRRAKDAFNLQAEPEKLRAEYGTHTLGQSCLLARRLVEAGVRYTMITHNNWDTHENNFGDLKDNLLPQLDQGLTALLRDLSDRGRLETTLVIVTGEFGRTPKINNLAGRDHWGNCFTVALAGGGVQGGRVVGASDEWAMEPAEAPVGPFDFATTLYHLLGIDPDKLVYTMDRRPVKLVDKGRILRELL